MTATGVCPRCRAQQPDSLLCDPCLDRAEHALRDLILLLPALLGAAAGQANATRWTRHGVDQTLQLAEAEAVEARSVPAALRSTYGPVTLPATPPPGDLAAADLAARVTADVWAVIDPLTALHARCPAGPACWTSTCGHASCGQVRAARAVTRGDTLAVLRWAAANTRLLRRLPDPAGAVNALVRAAGRVERALDTGAPDLFLGRCTVPDVRTTLDPDTGRISIDTSAVCGADLFARLGDSETTCGVCGAVYPVAARRGELLDAIRDRLARPATIARALSSLDVPVTAGQLDTWISRDKRLHEQGRARRDGLPLILADPVLDDDGKPVYLLGAVMDRVEALAAAEERRRRVVVPPALTRRG